jgi:hypothetical protein
MARGGQALPYLPDQFTWWHLGWPVCPLPGADHVEAKL